MHILYMKSLLFIGEMGPSSSGSGVSMLQFMYIVDKRMFISHHNKLRRQYGWLFLLTLSATQTKTPVEVIQSNNALMHLISVGHTQIYV